MAKKKVTAVPVPKKNQVKEIAVNTASVVLAAYILFSVIGLLGGLAEGGGRSDYKDCYDAPSRLRSLFPTFTLGCYMSAPTEQKYYDYDSYVAWRSERNKDEEIADLKESKQFYRDGWKRCSDELDSRKK